MDGWWTGLDEFRDEMLADTRIREARRLSRSATRRFRAWRSRAAFRTSCGTATHNGPCEVQTISDGSRLVCAVARTLDAYDVFVRDNEAVSILEKVVANGRADAIKSLAAKVSADPAVWPSNVLSRRRHLERTEEASALFDPAKVKLAWIARADIPRNDRHGSIKWKVFLRTRLWRARSSSATGLHRKPDHCSGRDRHAPRPILSSAALIARRRLRVFASYLRTRFVRFLVSLRKSTQHVYSDRYLVRPDLPMEPDLDRREALHEVRHHAGRDELSSSSTA